MTTESGFSRNVWWVVMIVSVLFLAFNVFAMSNPSSILETALSKYAGSSFDLGQLDKTTRGFLDMSMIKPLWEGLWAVVFGIFTALKLKQMKIYALKKSSLLLVLETPQKDKAKTLKKLKRIAMRKTLKHLSLCTTFFAIILIIIHRILFSMVKKTAENAYIPIIEGVDYYLFSESIVTPISDVIPLYIYSVPLIAGIILAIASWTYLRRNHIPQKF